MDVDTLLAKAGDAVSVGRAFGPPVERDGALIIPVAWVAGGGGGGSGADESATKRGAGGGFGGLTWPLGVYVIKDGTARWVPALDATRIVLGLLALVRTIAKISAVGRVKRR